MTIPFSSRYSCLSSTFLSFSSFSFTTILLFFFTILPLPLFLFSILFYYLSSSPCFSPPPLSPTSHFTLPPFSPPYYKEPYVPFSILTYPFFLLSPPYRSHIRVSIILYLFGFSQFNISNLGFVNEVDFDSNYIGTIFGNPKSSITILRIIILI